MLGLSPSLMGLFLLSLATSTPIPIPLDILVVAMAKADIGILPIMLFGITGLLIGATVDYFIGRFSLKAVPLFRKNKKDKKYKQAKKLYEKYGQWTLLFSFTPFIGKYFPLLAGVMELSFYKFLFFFLSGKLIYYGIGLAVLKLI